MAASNDCGSPHFRPAAPMPSLAHVATFVIETYLSRARAGELPETVRRLREAVARAPTREQPVRYVRSFFVPQDEICSHVVEAPSIDVTSELTQRAGLQADRIVEASAPDV